MQNRLSFYLNRERVMGDGIILSFDPKNVHVELIIYLFELKKGYGKWHDPFLDPKNGYAKWHNLFLIIKMIMQNDIAGISVGSYCIRPLRMSPKGTYD